MTLLLVAAVALHGSPTLALTLLALPAVLGVLSALLEQRARRDLATFAAMVLRDERTGKPVKLARHQKVWFTRWQKCKRTITIAPSEFTKSYSLAAYIAWRIACDPTLRIGLLSATKEQAVRLLRLVEIVMRSPGFQRVFPHVQIDRCTADELTVTGRPSTAKDVNVLAGAFDLSSMLGARFDVACCDDVVSRENTRTSAARDLAYQAFLNVTASRLAPDGEIHVVNTCEHSDDIPHRLAKLPGWHFEAFPALDSNGNPTWPARHPIERLEAYKLEHGTVGFQRGMLCIPLNEAKLPWTLDDLERALQQGRNAVFSPLGGRVIIGLDPAWTTSGTSDESGIVMVTIDSSGFRHVVHVEGQRLHHDRLADRVVELARANKAVVYVESNGAGGVIADIIGKRVPCKALATTRTSKQARVEALAAELSSGRWCFSQPLGAPGPELRKLVDELSTFSFESHTGDRASALLLACEGARTIESRPKARWLNWRPNPIY